MQYSGGDSLVNSDRFVRKVTELALPLGLAV